VRLFIEPHRLGTDRREDQVLLIEEVSHDVLNTSAKVLGIERGGRSRG